ncbi:MAG: hypothetical protein WBI17_10060 [Clostridiaceae bacterium]
MKNKMGKKDILAIVLIPAGGYLLFYAAVMLYWASFELYKTMMLSMNLEVSYAYSGLKMILLVLFLFITWRIYDSRLGDLAKATFTILPAMIGFTALLNKNLEPYSYIFTFSIMLAAFLFYYLKQKSWYYFYAITLAVVYLIFIVNT